MLDCQDAMLDYVTLSGWAGLIYLLIIQNGDHAVAYEMCLRLMETGYAPIWTECKTLAQSEHFSDIQAKYDLLYMCICLS